MGTEQEQPPGEGEAIFFTKKIEKKRAASSKIDCLFRQRGSFNSWVNPQTDRQLNRTRPGILVRTLYPCPAYPGRLATYDSIGPPGHKAAISYYALSPGGGKGAKGGSTAARERVLLVLRFSSRLRGVLITKGALV